MERLSPLVSAPRPFTGGGVSRSTFELDRSHPRDHEIGPAFRATDLIAAVDVELVDFDIRIARGAAGHERFGAAL